MASDEQSTVARFRQQALDGTMTVIQAKSALFLYRAAEDLQVLAAALPRDQAEAIRYGAQSATDVLSDATILAAVERIAAGEGDHGSSP